MIPPKQDSLQNSNNATSKSQRNQPKNAHDVNMYRQSINKQMGYQSEESSSKDNQPQPENHAKTSDTEQTQKTSSSHLQSNNHSAQKSEGRTPNYSKKITLLILKISMLHKSLKKSDVKENVKSFKKKI